MAVVFRVPTPADLDALAINMRAMDVKECALVAGLSPRATLDQCVGGAEWASIAEVDGRVVCVFGVTEASFLGGEAYPWMLCADGIERHARVLLAATPRFVNEMRAHYEHLSNVVHADNRAAIRFIRWCGFELGEEVILGGERFLRFTWETAKREAA